MAPRGVPVNGQWSGDGAGMCVTVLVGRNGRRLVDYSDWEIGGCVGTAVVVRKYVEFWRWIVNFSELWCP